MNCEDCEKLGLVIGLKAEDGYRYCWLCIAGYKIQWEEERKNRSLWVKLFTEPMHEAQEDFFRQLKLKKEKPLPKKEGKLLTTKQEILDYYEDEETHLRNNSNEYHLPGITQFTRVYPEIRLEVVDNIKCMTKEVRVLNTETKRAKLVKLPYIQARYLNSYTIPSVDVYSDIVAAIKELSSKNFVSQVGNGMFVVNPNRR